ncbi:tonB-system energizer ExbB [Pseudomonas mangiferae]|uniref:Biopolymer transport protein ExbB n=1 Tax=Pseudomonas mangiferae TaxID=2593654 RepID=A0A553GYH2_9PSED|nr:tonB-system energizer ExbB [Pseudomonas mangiferae]
MNSLASRALPLSFLPSRVVRLFAALCLGLLIPAGAMADAAAPAPAAAPESTPATPTATPAVPAATGEAPATAPVETAPAAPTADASVPVAEADDQPGLAHDLSPWGMYQNADMVVKGVMIGLAIASVLTWTVWLAKGIELIAAKRRLRRELLALKSARTLSEAGEKADRAGSLSRLLVHDALEEVKLSASVREREGIKERVSFRLERLVAASGRRMSQGTGVLATIGSTAPFVGLFGTVWGIMNSFIGIARSQTTNLAVVAPGIAEALLATAMGLVAAIPAVVIYNVFARSIAGYKAQVADASAQVLLLVSRDLDQLPAERNSQPHMVKVG